MQKLCMQVPVLHGFIFLSIIVLILVKFKLRNRRTVGINPELNHSALIKPPQFLVKFLGIFAVKMRNLP